MCWRIAWIDEECRGQCGDLPNRRVTASAIALVIDYYGEERPADKAIVYVPSAGVAAGGAEWVLTHSIDRAGDNSPPAKITSGGPSYVWVRSFKYGGISGWTWHLYRREPLAR